METSTTETEARITVPKQTVTFWRTNFRQGDKKKIANAAGTNRNRVSDAFQGLATPTLIKAINNFYKAA